MDGFSPLSRRNAAFFPIIAYSRGFTKFRRMKKKAAKEPLLLHRHGRLEVLPVGGIVQHAKGR